MSKTKPIHEIIRLAGGNPSGLARKLGITRQAVDQWTRVPVEHCLAIEELSGISKNELRPDVYGPREKGNGHKAA